ncbi:MAG: biotin synthase BioB [Myxococcales bacterium]|jgi:biotin synthase|nr:biotin synthase BioB [Myxococcales bacterium]
MNRPIDAQEARELLQCQGPEVHELLQRAHRVRMAERPAVVSLCSIYNAKSGHCTEDCRFCAQSAHNDVQGVATYDLRSEAQMMAAGAAAQDHQARHFSIVTSGLAVDSDAEIERLARTFSRMREELRVLPCASLGNISRHTLQTLKDAGLTRYHCNLETAESFYPHICTTRPWQDARDTIVHAKELGLATCCGGLFGLGETLAQRVELLAAVASLDVDSVPINFFHPVPGTRIDNPWPLTPLACLQIVAVARLMMPGKEIRVCGGREYHLRELQSWLLISGADGLMVGGYLTTQGRRVENDLDMVRSAGFATSFDAP